MPSKVFRVNPFLIGAFQHLGIASPDRKRHAFPRFNCVEQYIQYSKAVAATDDVTAARILKADAAAEQSRLGNSIATDVPRWEELELKAMRKAIELKFIQNDTLKNILLNTRSKEIGAARGKDQKLGIGISIGRNDCLIRTNWTRENKMGSMLMALRDQL